MYDFIEKIAENLLVYDFQVEGERAEAVVAADHGAHGVFIQPSKKLPWPLARDSTKGFMESQAEGHNPSGR